MRNGISHSGEKGWCIFTIQALWIHLPFSEIQVLNSGVATDHFLGDFGPPAGLLFFSSWTIDRWDKRSFNWSPSMLILETRSSPFRRKQSWESPGLICSGFVGDDGREGVVAPSLYKSLEISARFIGLLNSLIPSSSVLALTCNIC